MPILSMVLQVLLSLLMIAMFVRGIMSYFPELATSKMYDILFAITEPFVMPARFIFEKLNISDNFFIDIPYMVTDLVLLIVSWLLP